MLNETFSVIFKHRAIKKLPKERLMIGQLIYFGLFEEKWGRNTCEWNTREESLQALASLKCIHRKCNTELHNYYSTASRFFFLHRCCNSNIFQRLFSRFAGYSLFRRFLSCFCCCYTLFENNSKCRIWIFQFWHFLPIFDLLKLTCLVTLFDRKLQVFKNSPKWTIFGIFN